VSSREFVDSGEKSFLAGGVTEGKILRQNAWIKFRTHAGIGEKRLDLAAENKCVILQAIVKRFNPETITGSEEFVPGMIPNDEGEHAAQMLHAFRPILFVKMNDTFGVTIGSEGMAAREQLWAEFSVVVNFPVEYDPERAILVGKRLMAGLEVDDAKTAHREAGAVEGECSSIIGTAMNDLPVHSMQGGIVGRAIGFKVKDAADAAHSKSLRAARGASELRRIAVPFERLRDDLSHGVKAADEMCAPGRRVAGKAGGEIYFSSSYYHEEWLPGARVRAERARLQRCEKRLWPRVTLFDQGNATEKVMLYE